MNMWRHIAVPMHPEGRKFIALFAAGTIAAAMIWTPLLWVGAGLTLWCYYFFRDPLRSVPQGDHLVICPADGVVSLITETRAPAELNLPDVARLRVSVFMSVFNCHVNRAPVAGMVERIVYHKGRFFNASLDKASEHNERNLLLLRRDDGTDVVVVQIAGLVARRIVCFAEETDRLEAGARFGLIRFGSRLDIYLPAGVQPLVSPGQTTRAGETILADLRGDQQGRVGKLI